MSYLDRHIAPASSNPRSRAPLLLNSTNRVYRCRIGGEIVRQPTHRSSNRAGSRLSAMIRSMAVISRHSDFGSPAESLVAAGREDRGGLGIDASGQYWPLP